MDENIISEINNLLDTSEEMKEFLKWILLYERGHSEDKLIQYKHDIEKKVDELELRKIDD